MIFIDVIDKDKRFVEEGYDDLNITMALQIGDDLLNYEKIHMFLRLSQHEVALPDDDYQFVITHDTFLKLVSLL